MIEKLSASSGCRRLVIPVLARAEHQVRVLGATAAAVVAAEGHEEIASLNVEVMPQDHAAESQIGLHVEERERIAPPISRAQKGITCI